MYISKKPKNLRVNMNLKNKKSFPLPHFVENTRPITPKDSQIVSHSLYRKPIIANIDSSNGNSRKWGDASLEVKTESMLALISESMKRGFSRSQASFVLATSYVESGFNPDAAAGPTSAGGLGQFVKKTAKACGLDGMEVFSIPKASSATVRYLKNIFDSVARKNQGLSEAELFVETYSHYHDGGIISQDTKENISRARVLPLVSDFEAWISEMELNGGLNYIPSIDKRVFEEDKSYSACRI